MKFYFTQAQLITKCKGEEKIFLTIIYVVEHLHLPIAVLFPPNSQLSLSQPLLYRLKSLGLDAAPFSVVLHNSIKKRNSKIVSKISPSIQLLKLDQFTVCP